ncbi:unnamed protein product [Schistosoma margrebowiei]|uniref:Uncharacterized protein n=1 Tax=Schistosoma margrebowiei TaxID=48269 RepID=A0A183LC70_9TREM|nr:unnamed protein product [Schistosoma margrebowiei]
MVVGGSQQGTLDLRFVLLGTCQQGVPVILRQLITTQLDGEMGIIRKDPATIRLSICYLNKLGMVRNENDSLTESHLNSLGVKGNPTGYLKMF